ncbi:hypothetical protein C8Q77DRAFT_100814 [Trametes polyzona]|nr:hypothetical protein C8Q77DRAFT_100814 [Trametes polyzona]
MSCMFIGLNLPQHLTNTRVSWCSRVLAGLQQDEHQRTCEPRAAKDELDRSQVFGLRAPHCELSTAPPARDRRCHPSSGMLTPRPPLSPTMNVLGLCSAPSPRYRLRGTIAETRPLWSRQGRRAVQACWAASSHSGPPRAPEDDGTRAALRPGRSRSFITLPALLAACCSTSRPATGGVCYTTLRERGRHDANRCSSSKLNADVGIPPRRCRRDICDENLGIVVRCGPSRRA